MKKHYLLEISLLISFLFGINFANAANINVGGTISSSVTWIADTVKVTSNLTVNDGVTLTIPAGTYIEMQGHYRIYVQGQILAEGTKTNKIVFTAKDQSIGWSGIRYYRTPTTNDTSRFTHCIISYAKANVGGSYDKIGGAFLFYRYAKAVIKNCYISNNYATYYGGAIALRYYSNIKLINNVIVNNSASSRGGGIYSYASSPKIINNTIANNQSSNSGGIYISAFNGEIRNSIIYGNSASSHPNIYGTSSRVSNCNIGGGYTMGSNILDTIPYFVNATSGAGNMYNGLLADYSLMSTSTLIDKGENSFAISNGGDNFDINGNFRYDGRIIDLGAYEYIASTELCGYITSNTTLSGNVLINCNVTVNSGVTLTIEPGTDIIFTGKYYLDINGRLLAQGTKDNYIGFTAWNKTGGWKGIIFTDINTANDTSKVEYCNISYKKNYFISPYYYGAIYVYASHKVLIRNNIISNNYSKFGAGVSIRYSNVKVVGNLIVNNRSTYRGGGIYMEGTSSYHPLIVNNTIANNKTNITKGAGIYKYSSIAPTLKNNIIYNNKDNIGNHAREDNLYPNTLTATYNCIEGGYTGTGNISSNPLFKNPTPNAGIGYNIDNYNFTVQEASPCIDVGTTTTTDLNLPEFDLSGKTRVFNNRIDIGAYEDKSTLTLTCTNGNTIISADETWDANNIQIDCDVEIQNGATVTILPGTKVKFLGHHRIYVKGALLARGTVNDSILFTANDTTAGWDGVQIDYPSTSNDSSVFDYCYFEYAKRSPTSYYLTGGAISVYRQKKIRISNSLFKYNRITTGYGYGSAFSLRSIYPSTAYIDIYNNTISDNTGKYGVVGLTSLSANFRNNKIINNTVVLSGEAMYISSSGGNYYNNLFTGNNTRDGAVKIYSSSSTESLIFYNNIIVNNESVQGGGIFIQDSKPEIYNNTIANNYASSVSGSIPNGGGIYFYNNADAKLKNNIIYGNTTFGGVSNQICLSDVGSDPKFYNNDIEGGLIAFSGTGAGINYSGVYTDNIDVNPDFINPTAGSGRGFDATNSDWSLPQANTLINAGNSSSAALGIGDKDYAGNIRFSNGRIDIGALENQDPLAASCTISENTVWDADTIRVTCDVTIGNTKKLTIKEGTNVMFMGHYEIIVNGAIEAIGTADKKINFLMSDTTGFYDTTVTTGGWNGINFNSIIGAINDSSKFEFCIFSNAKAVSNNYQLQSGGAINIYNSPGISVSNCIFSNNYAFRYGGAIYIESSNIRFNNNIVCNNAAGSYGGGMYINDCNFDFVNNTIVNNKARYYAGVYFSECEMQIENSIFWGNHKFYYPSNHYYSQIGLYKSSLTNIYNNNIQYGQYKVGSTSNYNDYIDNLNVDPEFINPSESYGLNSNGLNANWSLAPTSPMLNKALYGTSAMAFDFAGNKRIVADTIDIGAYEIQLSTKFIDVQPNNKSVCVGLPLTLSTHATVNANYQWQKDGVSIPGATNNIYLKPMLTLLDTGRYNCIISNENGSIGTDTIEVIGQTMPVVTSSPTSTDACIGTSVTFTGAADGTEPLTYSWYNTNGALGSGTSSSYTIASVSANDASTYRLNISNMCGTAFTNGATFTVKTTPTVTDISATGDICENGSNTYTTSATGTAPITYQWYKAGVAIPSATSVSYSISNAPTSAAGTYYCIATNDCGTDQTNQSVLTVNELPSISVQPVSTIICENQSYTFSVTASGAAPLTYQWYKGGVAINNANNNTYTISSIASSDDGTNYYCIVSNSCSSATSTTATLTVQTAPSISSQTSSIDVCAGTIAQFSITAIGDPNPSYQWYNGSGSISGATNTTYSIGSSATSDAGNYYCVATNTCGSTTSNNIPLTVKSAPSITSQPSTLTKCENQSALFDLQSTGTAPLNYQWYKGASSITGATSSSYLISPISTNDAANYKCIVTNSCGNVTSDVVSLTVNTNVSISSQSNSQTICEGTSPTLTISTSGTTPITYQWYDENGAITGKVTNSLNFTSIGTSDEGNYYCIATNTCATATSSTIALSVDENPTIATNPASTDVCENLSAVFNISANGTAPFTYQWSDANGEIVGATNSSYLIPQVSSTDAGNYTVKVINSCGNVISSAATLTVKTNVSITNQSTSNTVCNGASPSFSVTASGTAPITYQWYKNNNSISTNATNSTYNIASAVSSDEADYFVIATNSCNTVQSNMISLTVKESPSISSQPSDATVCTGSSVQFNVSATGTQPMTYQWYDVNGAISGATSSNYLISQSSTSDAGTYYAIVTNSCSDATTNNATLTVNSPVSISTQPSGSTVCETSAASMSVTVSGTTPITYQWFVDGNTISGATNNAYSITNTTLANAADYFVTAANSCNSVQSNTINLSVEQAPSISSQPADATVCTGSSVQFNISATGTAPMTYQWYDANGAITGATSLNYLISQTSTSDAGAYYSIVTNSCGNATTNNATLTVNSPVSISTQPSSSTICETSAASMSVTVSGTTPINYQWFVDGDTISGATNDAYSITNATTADADDYYVIAANSCNSIQSNTVNLTVDVAPSISSQPASVTSCSGSSAQFYTTASGTSPFTYQWYNSSGAINGATNSSYIINQISTLNAGDYYTEITNSCGTATTNNATLTVNSPVSISTQPNNITICDNSTATMSITVTGTTPITYQWYVDGDTVVSGTNSIFSINNADTANEGNYYVRASNLCNYVQSNSVSLTINETPSITSQPTNSIVCSGSSAQFNTIASGTGPITYQWYNSSGSITGANNPSYLISQTNATDASNYYVEVTNSCGTTNSNNALLTVNQPVAITSQPNNINICDNSSATMSLTVSGTNPITYQWFAMSDTITGATNNTYTINNTDTSDEGDYFVIASNLCNSIQSYTVSINIDASPSVISQPSNTTVCSGSSSLFSVGADGATPLIYQWYDVNGEIIGANNTNYIISQSSPNDAGTYYVKVSNNCGNITSNNSVLTVIEPLAITTQPTDIAICENASASMSLTVTGTAPITYQWFAANDSINGATNNTYNVNNADTNNVASYFVIAENSCGSVQSNSIDLSISSAPSILTQSTGATKCIGGSFSFNVNVNGTSPFDYQWLKDSDSIQGANSALYMINTLDTADAATYYCTISNACGTVSTNNKVLIINSFPNIVSQSNSISQCENSTANFNISATGSNPLAYQWYNDTGLVAGANANSYVIPSTSILNAGSYYCTISNNCGSVTSSVKTLTVNTAPVIIAQSSDDTICEGISEVFQVGVTGTNPISYQWYKGNVLIPTALSSYMSIPSVDTNDIGVYHSVATNLCGNVQSNDIHLHINQLAKIISQSGDSSRCENEAMTFQIDVTGTSPIDYQWYKGSNPIIGSVLSTHHIDSVNMNDAGFYHLDVSNICNSTSSNYKQLTVHSNPVVELGDDTTFCDGGILTLSAGYGYQAQWNTGSYNNQISVFQSGSYFVNVSDQFGCSGISDTINVNVVLPYANQELCMVGIDSATNKSVMVWEKTPSQGIVSFNMYKESAVSNVWNLIGNVPYDSLSIFIDPSSTPNIKPERYSISVVDSCGNESSRSPSHRTMHLTINQGQAANDWNLIWNAYQGFTPATYRIYRADSTMNFVKVDSIAGSSSYTYLWTDYAAPSGMLYYLVEIVHPNGGCSPTKANTNYNTSRSNTASNGMAQNTALSPDFIADVTYGNAPMIVHFYDQTTNGTVDSWSWEFGDGGTSEVNNPVHQYDSAGVYTVVLLVENQYGIQPIIKSNFIDVMPNGIINIHNNFDVQVFPNPYKGKTNIAYALIKQTDVKIEVYNSLGEIVTTIVDEKQASGSYKYQFSAADNGFAQGVYYLRMTLDDEVITKRLVEVK